jgi:hypothetical protein
MSMSTIRTSIAARVRAAYASSLLVRSLMLGAVGLGVTVAGIAAGALIVAPVVATATRIEAPTSVTTEGPSTFAAVRTAAASAWSRLDAGTANVLASMPEPVARYALPTVAVASITGALLALFLPSRDAGRQPTPRTAMLLTPARGAAPLAAGRVSAKKRTPSAVEALAASGASAADIARRTGLPLDAVQLLLTISNGPRQFHPHSA